MTFDEAVALSLAENLSRVGLTARLLDGDPELCERARPLLTRAREARAQAAAAGIEAVAWNEPRYPARLLTTSDCPPLLWYRGTLAAVHGPAVAIVGARSASVTGVELAERLATICPRGVSRSSAGWRGVSMERHIGGRCAPGAPSP